MFTELLISITLQFFAKFKKFRNFQFADKDLKWYSYNINKNLFIVTHPLRYNKPRYQNKVKTSKDDLFSTNKFDVFVHLGSIYIFKRQIWNVEVTLLHVAC